MILVSPGSTNVSGTLVILDAGDGTPEQGVVAATPGLALWYRRTGGAKVAIAPSDLALLTSPHSDGGIIHIDDGYYRIDIPDAAFAVGADEVIVGGAATGMVIISDRFQLSLDPIEDGVWDATLSAGAHANLFSAGKRLQNMILRGGTAIAGGANWIQFPGPWSATDGIYEENIVSIVDGTGAGQTRLIVEYDGGTRRAYVDRDWAIPPAGDSEIELLPFAGILLSNHGVATAGTATSVTLAVTASAIDHTYIGSVVYISTGTGAGQIRLITAYDGGTKEAIVSDDWTTTPDNTSIYKILPVGRVIVDSLAADAVSAIETGVWTYVPRTLTSASTAPGTGLEEQIWTVLRGDTLDRTFATIAADGSITKCQLTVKLHPGPQPDADAILAVDNVTGLIRLNGTSPALAYTATFTLPGGVLTIPAATMAQLEAPKRWHYDVQVWRGADVETIEIGRFVVVADVSRLVV